MAASQIQQLSPNDFIFAKLIGQGSYASVYLAKKISTGKNYAIKVLKKRQLIEDDQVEYAMREKDVLQILLGCPNYFVKMYAAIQDDKFLYFVLNYAKNGDLFSYILRNNSLDLDCAKFYTAELVLALEVLRSKGIVHRDFKPENILFDANWHIQIADFGCAKFVSENEIEGKLSVSSSSFVGTPEFMSPEVISECSVSFASDLWSLGCVVYQMVFGKLLFRAVSLDVVLEKIQKLEYSFPEGFNATTKDLVEKLVVIEPKQRLGALDSQKYESIRNHPFFCGIDWNNIGEPPTVNSGGEDLNNEVLFDGKPGFNE